MQKRHLGPRPVFCQFPSAEMAACAHLIQISTEETSKENVGKIISLQQFAIKLLSDKILNVKCDEGTPASIPSITYIFFLKKSRIFHQRIMCTMTSSSLFPGRPPCRPQEISPSSPSATTFAGFPRLQWKSL